MPPRRVRELPSFSRARSLRARTSQITTAVEVAAEARAAHSGGAAAAAAVEATPAVRQQRRSNEEEEAAGDREDDGGNSAATSAAAACVPLGSHVPAVMAAAPPPKKASRTEGLERELLLQWVSARRALEHAQQEAARFSRQLANFPAAFAQAAAIAEAEVVATSGGDDGESAKSHSAAATTITEAEALDHELVQFNVGGAIFTAQLGTLRRAPNSMLFIAACRVVGHRQQQRHRRWVERQERSAAVAVVSERVGDPPRGTAAAGAAGGGLDLGADEFSGAVGDAALQRSLESSPALPPRASRVSVAVAQREQEREGHHHPLVDTPLPSAARPAISPPSPFSSCSVTPCTSSPTASSSARFACGEMVAAHQLCSLAVAPGLRVPMDQEGRIFFDRSPVVFSILLNLLRGYTNKFDSSLTCDVFRDAMFYGVLPCVLAVHPVAPTPRFKRDISFPTAAPQPSEGPLRADAGAPAGVAKPAAARELVGLQFSLCGLLADSSYVAHVVGDHACTSGVFRVSFGVVTCDHISIGVFSCAALAAAAAQSVTGSSEFVEQLSDSSVLHCNGCLHHNYSGGFRTADETGVAFRPGDFVHVCVDSDRKRVTYAIHGRVGGGSATSTVVELTRVVPFAAAAVCVGVILRGDSRLTIRPVLPDGLSVADVEAIDQQHGGGFQERILALPLQAAALFPRTAGAAAQAANGGGSAGGDAFLSTQGLPSASAPLSPPASAAPPIGLLLPPSTGIDDLFVTASAMLHSSG